MAEAALECVWDLGALLGEGPVWHDEALWFVDIKRHRVHRLTPATGEKHQWDAPEQVCWVVPAEGGRWLAGLQSGVAWFDPAEGSFTRWLDPEPDLPGNRLNDATVDARGRLWFGTMDDAEKANSGRVYRLRDDGRAVAAGPRCPITNGPAVSPDGALLYPVDTHAGHIWRYRIADDGTLEDGEVLITVDPADGHPDGAICDAEGCIWVALYGGWGVRRYSPAGELLAYVALPVSDVTKIALGGPDLRTAYATTASKDVDAATRAEQPLAGGVFAFRVDTPGVALPLAKIGLPAKQ